MNYKPFCSTEIIFLDKKEMVQNLLDLNSKNIVLIMSKSSVLRWDLSSFIMELEKNCRLLNGKLIWINKINSNPTQLDIIKALGEIGNNKINKIIAFGGGSSIDLAKGISAFHSIGEKNYTIDKITQRIKKNNYNKDFIDIIALPTTSGTGSEVTQWATIWDVDKISKFSIDSPNLKPKIAIIVPEFTLSLSKEMTLSSGLDAMCQGIESYWSKHTTPIVQEIAYRAVKIIIQNLRKSIENPQDITIRIKLCKASVLAGLAFSKTRTTACHSLSYPLTMLYGIPHGLAVAITLNEVGQINKGNFPNDKELYNLFFDYGGIDKWINMVCKDVVEMRLTAFGISSKDIPLIVDNAFAEGRMYNNPVNLTRKDVVKILNSIL
ncbi:MAG: phosphonoacetaldehyde reductase [Eubacteriales bacterium]